MKKVPMPLLIVGMLVLSLGLLAIGMMTGYIPLRDIFASFVTFVFTLVIITVLAVIGAVFIGMLISHRVFSSRQFTTFEEEMLKMKEDLNDIKETLDEMKEEKDEDKFE